MAPYPGRSSLPQGSGDSSFLLWEPKSQPWPVNRFVFLTKILILLFR